MPDDRTTAEERRKRKREKGGFVARLSVKVAPARSLGLPAIAENNGMARRLRRSRVNRTDIIGNILPQNGKTPSMRRISILQQFAGKWDSPFQNSSPRIWKAASGGPRAPETRMNGRSPREFRNQSKPHFGGRRRRISRVGTQQHRRRPPEPALNGLLRNHWNFVCGDRVISICHYSGPRCFRNITSTKWPFTKVSQECKFTSERERDRQK